jgi:solute carrier family 35 (adenosine 3'-phospho 5'-phosphosulfate transporter), member B3
MSVVKQYGGVTAVLVGNARKAMTMMLSFLLFPKPFTSEYAIGGMLVLTGLMANVYMKSRQHQQQQQQQQQQHSNSSYSNDSHAPTRVSGATGSVKSLA